MFKFVRNIFSIERDSRFVARILFLSVPSALVFMVLAALKLISPLLAIVSLASVVIFNLLMLFPITRHVFHRGKNGLLTSWIFILNPPARFLMLAARGEYLRRFGQIFLGIWI